MKQEQGALVLLLLRQQWWRQQGRQGRLQLPQQHLLLPRCLPRQQQLQLLLLPR